jgi:hypothetical protein
MEGPEILLSPSQAAARLQLRPPYFGAVATTLVAECWIESFRITVSSRLYGGAVFEGKSGRRTANACQAKATEISTIAVAHFMSCRLIKIQKCDKKILRDRDN